MDNNQKDSTQRVLQGSTCDSDMLGCLLQQACRRYLKDFLYRSPDNEAREKALVKKIETTLQKFPGVSLSELLTHDLYSIRTATKKLVQQGLVGCDE